MAGFAYRHIDWFIVHEIDNYLDLNAEQKRTLKQQLTVKLEVHRLTLLPQYTAFLDQLSMNIEDGLTENEARSTIQNFRTLYGTTTQMLIDLVAPLMAELSEQQIQHMEKSMHAANQEQSHDYELDTDIQKHYKGRCKRNIKRVKYWAGSVDSAQRTLITEKTLAFPNSYKLWHDYNKNKQQEMLKLLRNKPDVLHIKHFLTAWWIDSAGKSATLEVLAKQESEILIDYIQSVDASFTEEQRQHVIKRLQHFSNIFKKITN